ncbi:uncharacterized protein LOC23687500 isoform X2 [Aedes aegypti]|uniref:Uncharacterized protein n=1 Tax=Aedes aegypti TaxID=7159 RepID=A0A6I8TR25_AEDAE|nr:uncharacterized protein LOC23687500 isoform X2 [Aedes aegypti]
MILVCSICGASHYTQNCPEYAKGDHIEDKPSLNLSRSSVPNGLLIMDAADGSSCVVTSQKFAKGTRFGPLLAQKSYAPIKNLPFPLVLFSTPYYYGGDLDYDLQTLFNGRNVYLDTRNSTKCNWMIHVSLARFSNEQNLICYQENDEIYYTAIKDIELGDILRVWYSRSYAAKIGATLLEPSPYDICNNILRSVSLDYGLNLDQNQNYVDVGFPSTSASATCSSSTQSSMMIGGGSDVNNNTNHLTSGGNEMVTSGDLSYDKISLPPIDSLMKTGSPKYQSGHYHMFEFDLLSSGHGTMQQHHQQACDDFGHFNAPPAATITQQMHHSSQHHVAPELAQQHQPMAHHQPPPQQQQMVQHNPYGSYQALPDDTLTPADLINISLGASDMNITFDSFETSNLLGYDGGSSSGSNLGDSGIGSVGFCGAGQGMDGKLHSRYSSSTDSLATLNDSLGMVPPQPTATPNPGLTTAADPDADKKYPCEICLRKYMTKSNLDKHMRKHNLFLCVFCMKLFQLAEELKDHECTERKSKTAYLHCPKCLKVLSNSWSLQRHMKIHKDPNESVLMSSMEESSDKLLMEPKEETVFGDEIEPTALDGLKASMDPLEGGSGDGMMMVDEVSDMMPEPDAIRDQDMELEPEFESIPQPTVVAVPSLTTMPITNTSSSQDMITDVQAPNGKQLYKCIVCAKLFKNPNALEKHLRKVHTVYTVSNDYKTEKKVMTQINQKKTSPIKPAIAKALATKLTQKSKKMEAAAANGGEPTTATPSVIVTPEQPVHVPRQYNKKKHLNKMTMSPNASSGMQVAVPSGAPAIITNNSPGSTTGTTPNKSHSIIIISNLELTNNNLIDTSQLFLNQNTNALGNKIDLKVLNSTDKLPKLVPISNHHQQQQQPASTILPTSGNTIPSLHHPTTANLDGLNTIIEEPNHMMAAEPTGEAQLLTLSPIKIGNGSVESQQLIPDRTPDSVNNGFLSAEELSVDANDANSATNSSGGPQCFDGDSDNSSQQLTPIGSGGGGNSSSSYPCEECDRVFPKNYQLKRHMEIHDSTYYMCPYCDRSPLKAKTSVRKHLNTVHPERAPPKEEMNKFISTLVVKDEKILQELFVKNERKIRNKCAKQQAKQLLKQQQALQLQQQKQQQRLMENSVGVLEHQQQSNGSVSHVVHEVAHPEEMLTAYQGTQQSQTTVGGEEQNGYHGVEQIARQDEQRLNGEDESTLKRRSEEQQVNQAGHGGGRSLGEENKKIKLVEGASVGSELRYIAAATVSGNGALKYLRKRSLGVGEGSSSTSSSQSMPPPPPGTSTSSGAPTTIDSQIMLDNLFDNISIENYEFDDNSSIQPYNLIDERFKTSFDQIQEKLDAELSFDEEQLKWQNNLMANDSSNEIGDKLLNVEENIMLI